MDDAIISAPGVAHAYDLVQLLAIATTTAGTAERRAVRDALERIEQHSVALCATTRHHLHQMIMML